MPCSESVWSLASRPRAATTKAEITDAINNVVTVKIKTSVGPDTPEAIQIEATIDLALPRYSCPPAAL